MRGERTENATLVTFLGFCPVVSTGQQAPALRSWLTAFRYKPISPENLPSHLKLVYLCKAFFNHFPFKKSKFNITDHPFIPNERYCGKRNPEISTFSTFL